MSLLKTTRDLGTRLKSLRRVPSLESSLNLYRATDRVNLKEKGKTSNRWSYVLFPLALSRV